MFNRKGSELRNAARDGALTQFDKLLKLQAEHINVAGDAGQTVMHCIIAYAATHKKSDEISKRMMEDLLKQRNPRPNLSAKDKNKETPLQMAVRCGCLHLFVDLLKSDQTLFLYADAEMIKQLNAIAEEKCVYGQVQAEEKVMPQEDSGFFSNLFKSKPEAETAHELHAAVQKGDLEKVKILIEQNIKSNPQYINLKGMKGYTALHWAVDKCPKIIECLLDAGASLSIQDEKNKTVLDLAAELDRFYFFSNNEQRLNPEQKIAIQEKKLKEKRIAELIQAVINNNIDKVKELLPLVGANVVGKQSNTPLHVAAIHGHKELCLLLLEEGADIDAKRKSDGNTPLHLAAEYNQIEIAQLLIERKAKTYHLNDKEQDAANLAKNKGHTQMVALLSGRLSKEELKTEVLKVEMLKAVQEGKLDLVKQLHDQGVDINAGRQLLLHWALDTKHYAVAEYLIRAGINVDTQEADGFTPLHYVARDGHFDLCKLLIEKGAKINVTTKRKSTPLHLAAFNDNVNIALLLIENGASLTSLNNENKTPEDIARSRVMRTVLCAMRENSGSKADILMSTDVLKFRILESINCGDLTGVKKMIEAGADVNAVLGDHNRPILSYAIAAKNYNIDIVKYLIDQPDINLNAAEENGDTPLHWAAYKKNVDNVELCVLLIRRRASLTATNKKGETPLSYVTEEIAQQLRAAATEAEEKAGAAREDAEQPEYPEVPVVIEQPFVVKPNELIIPENDEPDVVPEQKEDPLLVDDTPRIPDDDYADIDASAYLSPVVEQNDQENLVEEEKIGDEPNDELPSSPNSEVPVTPKLLVQEEEINDELVDELPSSPNSDENIDEVDAPVMPQENIASPQSEFGPFGLFACVPKMPCGPKQDVKKSSAVISVQPDNAVAHVVANPAQPAAQSFSILDSFRMFISDAVGEGSNQAQPENAANASQVIS